MSLSNGLSFGDRICLHALCNSACYQEAGWCSKRSTRRESWSGFKSWFCRIHFLICKIISIQQWGSGDSRSSLYTHWVLTIAMIFRLASFPHLCINFFLISSCKILFNGSIYQTDSVQQWLLQCALKGNCLVLLLINILTLGSFFNFLCLNSLM